MTKLQFENRLPAAIKSFKQVTVLLQFPGDVRDARIRNANVKWTERGERTMVCFSRSAHHYGICNGPVGGDHQLPDGGFCHDVVLLQFQNGGVALVDNGIGQFAEVPHTHAAWLWVDRREL